MTKTTKTNKTPSPAEIAEFERYMAHLWECVRLGVDPEEINDNEEAPRGSAK